MNSQGGLNNLQCFSTRQAGLLLAVLGLLITLIFIKAPCGQCQPQYSSGSLRGAPGRNLALEGGNNGAAVNGWFERYDAVRRQAQMNPQERSKADRLMSQGLSIVVPGPEKAESQELMSRLVNRYRTACEQLKKLPLLNETEQLHRGYYQYFSDAQKLFSDYMTVQNHLFAIDETTGKPLAGQLMQRKESLEALDMQNRSLDEQLRQRYGIPPYRY